MNTNNAPERNILPMNIDLPSHDVLARKKAKGLKFTPIEMFIWCCEPGEGESSTFRSALSRLLAAMQPQVSESQPAAVSADAVERYKTALETIRTGDCVPWDVADKALKQQHNGS